MGDRANIKVVDGESTVFLYTHWSGTDLPEILQKALQRGKERWNDGQYLSRIIFCEMISTMPGTTALTGLTGFGISSVVGDGDDRIIIVDINSQTVYIQRNMKVFQEYIASGFKPDWGEQ